MKTITANFILLFILLGFIVSAQNANDSNSEIEKERARWNKSLIHDSTYEFNKKPNSLLVETVKGKKKGKALDIGMGQGRNSIFLAKKGWTVTGVDIADEAINFALEQAKINKVKIDARIIPMEKFDYGINQWNLILHVYEGCLDGDNNKLDKIAKSLKPGGLLIFEFFHLEAGIKMGRPDFGCTAANVKELVEQSKSFTILLYKEEEAIADYGLRLNKLVKMVAQKK